MTHTTVPTLRHLRLQTLQLCLIVTSVLLGSLAAVAAGLTAPSIAFPTTTAVTTSTATLGGNISSDGGSTITERGVVISPTSQNPNPFIGGGNVSVFTTTGTTGVFTVDVNGLFANTNYSFKAYAKNSIGTAYTSGATFTSAPVAPSVSFPTATNFLATSATLGARVTTDGGQPILERGVVYSRTSDNPNPYIGGDNALVMTASGTTGIYTTSVTGLAPNTDYSFKGYARNSLGTSYTGGSDFTTTAPAPLATTSAATLVTLSSATLNGSADSLGSASNVSFQYGTSSTLAGAATVAASPATLSTTPGAVAVSYALSGLSPHTTYYFRVSASNVGGVTNGTILNFTTANNNPTAANGTATATTGDQKTITLPFTTPDADGDTVSVNAVTGGSHLTVNSFSGTGVTFTPAANYIGTDTLTYTVSDGFGGTAGGVVTVTISDNDAPVIPNTPGTFSPLTIATGLAGTASLPDYTSQATASDNVGLAGAVVQSPVAGTAVGIGSVPVTLTATDAAGNAGTATFNVTVTDGTAPVIVGPAGGFLGLNATTDASGTAVLPDLVAQASASDNVAVVGPITQSPVAGTPKPVGPVAVTLSAKDAAGNIGTLNVIVMINDGTLPVITTVPADRTLAAGANGLGLAPDLTGEVVSGDNVAVTSTTQAPLAGASLALGQNDVTITVSDAAGNKAMAIVHVTVTDQTKPVISAPALGFEFATIATGLGGTVALPDYAAQATATDNVGVINGITQSPAAGTPQSVGTTPVTLSIADAAGNIGTLSFNIIVTDGTAPLITTAPADRTLNAGADGTTLLPDLTSEVVATDNVAVTTTTQDPVAGTVLAVGPTNVTISVRDDAGNVATAIVHLLVADVTNPVLTAPVAGFTPLMLTTGVDGTIALPDYAAQASATDNVGVVGGITQSPAVGTGVPAGPLEVTLTAKDAAGNAGTLLLELTVADGTKPSITSVPAASVLAADRVGHATLPDLTSGVTATDNVAVVGVVQSPIAGTVLNIGPTTVAFTVTDAAGNAQTAQTTVTVTAFPNHAPAFVTAPATLSTTEDRAVSFTVTTSDAESDPVTLTFTGPAHGGVTGSGPQFTYTPTPDYSGPDSFTITADDGFGGLTSNVVTVTVDDAPAAFVGRYSLNLSDNTSARSSLKLTVSAGKIATGNLRTSSNQNLAVLTRKLTTLQPATVKLADHSTLVLTFDGKGRVNATRTATTGTTTGEGTITPAKITPALVGAYNMVIDPGTGGYGWTHVVLAANGALSMSGRTPAGATISQALLLDRTNHAPIFLVGAAATHPRVTGSVFFTPTATSDFAGSLVYTLGSQSTPCDGFGAKFIPARSALPPGTYPLAVTGAGLNVSTTARLDKNNAVFVAAPNVKLTSNPLLGALATGPFKIAIRDLTVGGQPTGPTYSGTGVFIQKTARAYGYFLKSGQSGQVFLGTP